MREEKDKQSLPSSNSHLTARSSQVTRSRVSSLSVASSTVGCVSFQDTGPPLRGASRQSGRGVFFFRCYFSASDLDTIVMPSGFGQSLGGGGLSKQNTAFTQSIRNDARASVTAGTSKPAKCLKCFHRNVLKDGKCSTQAHVREDPNCDEHGKQRWARATEVAPGGSGGAGPSGSAGPSSTPHSPKVRAFLQARGPPETCGFSVTVPSKPDNRTQGQLSWGTGALGQSFLGFFKPSSTVPASTAPSLTTPAPPSTSAPPAPPQAMPSSHPSVTGATGAGNSALTTTIGGGGMKDSQDSQDTFVSASGVMVKEVGTSIDGALTLAAGGARAAIPSFIMAKLKAAREALGTGSSVEPLPELFRGELFTVVSVSMDSFDPQEHAYRGVKLTVLNWQRQRRRWLPEGRVPCARDGCTGHTEATKYGTGHGGVLTVLRTDGMHDYVTGVERRCRQCGTAAYDYDVSVTSKLPCFLQEELAFQPSAATKGASMVMSRDLATTMQYSMTQGREGVLGNAPSR